MQKRIVKVDRPQIMPVDEERPERYGRPVAKSTTITKGWSQQDTAILVGLVDLHRDKKNKWKLIAEEMPGMRTPGQVKEKFQRLQKTPSFTEFQSRVLECRALHSVALGMGGDGREGSPASVGTEGGPACEPPLFEAPSPLEDRRIVGNAEVASSECGEEAAALLQREQRLRSRKSASGFKGVSKAGTRWEAYIGNGEGGKRYLGRFDTPEAASEAYKEAFANLASSDLEAKAAFGKACSKCKRAHHTVVYCRGEKGHTDLNWDDCEENAENLRQQELEAELVSRREPKLALPPGVQLIRSPHAASGFQGVSKSGSKWESYVSVGSGKRYIGRFSRLEDAAIAYAIEMEKLRHESMGNARPCWSRAHHGPSSSTVPVNGMATHSQTRAAPAPGTTLQWASSRHPLLANLTAVVPAPDAVSGTTCAMPVAGTSPTMPRHSQTPFGHPLPASLTAVVPAPGAVSGSTAPVAHRYTLPHCFQAPSGYPINHPLLANPGHSWASSVSGAMMPAVRAAIAAAPNLTAVRCLLQATVAPIIPTEAQR